MSLEPNELRMQLCFKRVYYRFTLAGDLLLCEDWNISILHVRCANTFMYVFWYVSSKVVCGKHSKPIMLYLSCQCEVKLAMHMWKVILGGLDPDFCGCDACRGLNIHEILEILAHDSLLCMNK